MSLTDFQKKTAVHAFACLRRKDNARFLIADEVGLGKTIVAKAIIGKFLEESKDEFTVVYICNNQLLARKNLEKLNPVAPNDPNWIIQKPPINRLSLFPLEYYKSGTTPQGKKVCRFYALTPGTSLRISNSCGIVQERMLLYRLASKGNELGEETENIYRQGAENGWPWQKRIFNNEPFSSAIEQIYHEICGDNYLKPLLAPLSDKQDISQKRQLLSRYGAGLLRPDLVIFDEFQNYEQVFFPKKDSAEIEDEDEREFRGEIDIINSVFANLRRAPKYLLLSATPFAPLTMSEELAKGEVDLSSCEEFCRLIDWLNNNNQNSFRRAWRNYADKFKEYCRNQENEKAVGDARNEVQAIITGVMSRTERPMEYQRNLIGGIDLKNSVLQSGGSKVRKDLFSDNGELVEYEKYAYRPLSAMRDYVTFSNFIKKHPDDFTSYFLPCIDAAVEFSPYMRKLCEVMGDENGKLRPLLWVPPTVPSLDLRGAFKAAADAGYSKVLIFSHYRFIPRMISTALSARYEKDCQMSDSSTAEYKIFDSDNFRESVRNLLNPEQVSGEEKEIFLSPAKSVYWAFLKLLPGDKTTNQLKGRCWVWSVLIAVALLRKMLNSGNMPCIEAVVGRGGTREEKAARYCQYGCFGDAAYEYMFLLAQELHEKWDVDKIDSIGGSFFRVLRLRSNNLTLYFSEKNPKTEESSGEAKDEKAEDKLKIEAELKKYARKVRTHFADCFSEKEKYPEETSVAQSEEQLGTYARIIKEILPKDDAKDDNGAERNDVEDVLRYLKGIEDWNEYLKSLLPKEQPDRNKELQSAFNSPFKPFVLSTTSIGQEGLDFHWYCRKIMHWSLPSNPVDFDQREGRINRYGSFALRQTLAQTFLHADNRFTTWEDFWQYFIRAGGDNADGMIPYWLPPRTSESSRKIERIIPFYPLSREHLFIDDLLKLQAVYRMVIGQPHQDELMSLLRNLSDDARTRITNYTIALVPRPEKVENREGDSAGSTPEPRDG